jgi:two-component system cell cycle response regulator DivK
MMKKIMVVEDNEKNMYLICYILKDSKYEIIKATSGEEGVMLAVKEKPDLVLMDIQLPGIDGLEATKRIRETESGRNVPIIAITSYAMSGDRKKLINGGCTGYIEKPINLDILLSEIKKYI